MIRVVSLNLNGLRAAARKGVFDWLPAQKADIVCLQETRVQDHQLDDTMRAPDGMHAHYLHAEKPGYSGVGFWLRRPPRALHAGIGDARFDHEARVLTADYGELRVVTLYLPSGSSSEERQGVKYAFMDALLPWLDRQRAEAGEVLVCGDWNIAHREIDLKNWRGNRKNSGFLPEERAWMDRVFGDAGWVDVYRRLHPEAEGDSYTWWSNRGRAWDNNTGWRIDYHVATPGLAEAARKAAIFKDDRFSDHAPLTIDYSLPRSRLRVR